MDLCPERISDDQLLFLIALYVPITLANVDVFLRRRLEVRIRSSMRLLSLAALVLVLCLAIAPASFAGEDDGGPGPTQVGEVSGPSSTPAPASSTGPSSSGGVAGATHTVSKSTRSNTALQTTDTKTAVGGVQTGFGGMAVSSPQGRTIAIALASGGMLLLLVSGSGLVPLRRRSDG
jgi:hypothetical protein